MKRKIKNENYIIWLRLRQNEVCIFLNKSLQYNDDCVDRIYNNVDGHNGYENNNSDKKSHKDKCNSNNKNHDDNNEDKMQ